MEEKIRGLNDKDVEERIKSGKVNNIPKPPSRTLTQILRANILTSYNILNISLAILLILIGSPKDAVFIIIVIANIILGAFQEIHAKRILERLAVINSKRAYVIRNGKTKNITAEEIVIDDIMILKTGDQILVDCEVIQDVEVEVDESMITGESDSILKQKGSKLLSGSVVTAGQCYAVARCVGGETYAAKLANEARKFKLINSELQKSTGKIFKIIMWMILPLGLLLTTSQLMSGNESWKSALIGSVTGIIGMVPEGLILLTSTTFVVAVIRLSKLHTLVQELPATEVLARVDVLCLDKTGTITKGDLKVSEIIALKENNTKDVEKYTSAIAYSFLGGNQTNKAILNKFKENPNLKVKNKIPFSSKRKWTAVEFENEGTWILGAPEVILKEEYANIAKRVKSAAEAGKRILLLAKFNGEILSEDLNGDIHGIGLIFLEDIIRDNAEEAIDYFEKENVKIKIISGDNPITVSAIAKKVGIKNGEKYIDSRLLPESEEELAKVVEETCVFGRVTPHQKRRIVKALKSNEHTVAMTGDGVNDVLALKEADCGIAMASGADATKAVAQLVLMNSDFASLPNVVTEGRQLINNLEKVSELFLSKIVYFIIMCISFSLLRLPFPITPFQLTLIGSITIGIPSFFLALAPNKERIKKNFLKRVLQVSIPNGVMIGISTTIAFLIGFHSGLSMKQSSSLSLVVFTALSLFVVFKVSRPLNLYRILILFGMILLFIGSFTIPFIRNLFDIAPFVTTKANGILIITILGTLGMIFIPKIVKKIMNNPQIC
ncbi:HAD-IC family P-type ATPase [Clostridium senegalense]|uniref:cation-translocating P-type ATPase n=1 Tax=Clostridium senegalense TaxID=1465809 RepID=UPI001C100F05|nr:cation-translocating P-type ATPase [Clostridium senegalense]MBU5225935.1 HAD-IC family P-type ATPase [Clostridium senegalense]